MDTQIVISYLFAVKTENKQKEVRDDTFIALRYFYLRRRELATYFKMSAKGSRDIDYILDHYVGGGSRWQWLMLFSLFPTAWASFYPVFVHIFAAYEPTHRCFVPACDFSLSELNESHTDFTIPKEHKYTNIFMENEKLDPCRFKSYGLTLMSL